MSWIAGRMNSKQFIENIALEQVHQLEQIVKELIARYSFLCLDNRDKYVMVSASTGSSYWDVTKDVLNGHEKITLTEKQEVRVDVTEVDPNNKDYKKFTAEQFRAFMHYCKNNDLSMAERRQLSKLMNHEPLD